MPLNPPPGPHFPLVFCQISKPVKSANGSWLTKYTYCACVPPLTVPSSASLLAGGKNQWPADLQEQWSILGNVVPIATAWKPSMGTGLHTPASLEEKEGKETKRLSGNSGDTTRQGRRLDQREKCCLPGQRAVSPTDTQLVRDTLSERGIPDAFSRCTTTDSV